MANADKFLDAMGKNIDAGFEPSFVIPGQDVTGKVSSFSREISIGEWQYT